MSLFSTILNKFVADVNAAKMLVSDVNNLIVDQTLKVIADPVGVVEEYAEDLSINILGRQPNLLEDTVDILENAVQIVVDTGINVFNALPSTTPVPVFQEVAGNINARAGKVIVNTTTVSGASIGDLSWLIYTQNKATNTVMSEKWKLYNFTETVSGYDSSTYVDVANKQVAITFEGTCPDSPLSTWVLSEDGVSDLEIGLGLIPNQMREGYERFKTLMTSVQNTYGNQGYGISLAGHSLGGGLAEMMAGMYFIDTGIALPAIAQEAPGMLRQLKMYAEEQLIAGNSIHLPTGGTISVSGTLLQRAEQAKAIVSTFTGQSFSNVINLLTEQDVVGQVNYNADPSKDGHVGINIITPAILTPRELLGDIDYEALLPINNLGLTTPEMPKDPLNLFPGLSNMDLSRIDRHLPAQSEGLWSGSSLGLYDPKGSIGLGVQIERTNGAPIQNWAGSQTNTPEVKIFGTATGQSIHVDQYVTGEQNALVMSSTGNDIIYGSNNGDMLVGGSGDDIIYGGNGDNYISGGTGNAKLYGGTGNDIIYAGKGNSYMTGGGGSNLLFGGTSSNTFYWENGNDTMFNGQAGGTYNFIVANGAIGNSELKWERNFTNIGNSTVDIQGAMNTSSHLLFNFVDEIRFQDMKWSQSGNDIVMTDNLGDKAGTVTFKNAFTAFANNKDQLDFKFTNGHVYVDDVQYHVRAGAGTVTALEDAKYKGNVMVGSTGNDTLVAGSGNDLLFGGVGADAFVFNNNFGNDAIIGSGVQDKVQFNSVFNSTEFTAKHTGNDLVIGYQQRGTSTVNELTINNWFSASDKVNDFVFSDGSHYQISNTSFVRSY